MRNKLIIFDIKYYKPKSAQNQFILTQNSILCNLFHHTKKRRSQSPQAITPPFSNLQYYLISSLFFLAIFSASAVLTSVAFFFSSSLSFIDILRLFCSKYFSTPGKYSSSVPVLYLVIGLISTGTPPILKLSS